MAKLTALPPKPYGFDLQLSVDEAHALRALLGICATISGLDETGGALERIQSALAGEIPYGECKYQAVRVASGCTERFVGSVVLVKR